MPKIELRNGRILGDGQSPYIVAELNSSHNGKLEQAKLMIDAAKECGCDCVKLQSWSAESLYCDEYYETNPISKRIVSRFSMNEVALLELAEYCQNVGIDFSSTPYSESEVDFLVDKADAPFIKIASMEMNNIPFLSYIASKSIPIVLSTGMSTIDEIRQAIQTIESVGNKRICILHCVSEYPAEPEIINLNNISMLKEEFPDYPIGYSDHTIGYEVAAASIALGASLVEKHFTLDKRKMGMDNNMATEPAEMKALVKACQNTFSAMGDFERIILSGEKEQRLKMRRSLVTKRDLKVGDKIKIEDIETKRPGDGIPPTELKVVVGKILTIDVPKGHVLRWSQLD